MRHKTKEIVYYKIPISLQLKHELDVVGLDAHFPSLAYRYFHLNVIIIKLPFRTYTICVNNERMQ